MVNGGLDLRLGHVTLSGTKWSEESPHDVGLEGFFANYAQNDIVGDGRNEDHSHEL